MYRYLQDTFDVPLIIMLTDDEKFLHSPKLSIKECKQFALQNALDIIAIGFDQKKTFIFTDIDFIYGGRGTAFAQNILEMGKKTTHNQIKGTFGFNETYVLQFECTNRLTMTTCTCKLIESMDSLQLANCHFRKLSISRLNHLTSSAATTYSNLRSLQHNLPPHLQHHFRSYSAQNRRMLSKFHA